MDEFIGETIEVEQSAKGPEPVRFRWRGEEYEVAEVLSVWVDIGHGLLPPRSRKWYTRRHRRYYVVKDTEGRIFEMYLDYSNRSNPTWFLVKRLGNFPQQ